MHDFFLNISVLIKTTKLIRVKRKNKINMNSLWVYQVNPFKKTSLKPKVYKLCLYGNAKKE